MWVWVISYFCFSVQKNFIELYQAVQSKILLRQHLLFKIIMKNKAVKAKTFNFFSCLPRCDFPISHLPSSRCHLSSKLVIANKQGDCLLTAITVYNHSGTSGSAKTYNQKQIPIFFKTFYPQLQYNILKEYKNV